MRNTMTGVVTCGDINGIGPEIALKAIDRMLGAKDLNYVLVIPGNVFSEISQKTGIDLSKETRVKIHDIGDFKIEPGVPTGESGIAAFKALEAAFGLVEKNDRSFLVTAPISKYAFKLAGVNFPGHTELLAKWARADEFVMMFLSEQFKCALATIHVPLHEVSGLITKDLLRTCLKTVTNSLKIDFSLHQPRIALLGLNPHAGENGVIGDEEINVIKPAIDEFKGTVEGPFPPDAFFARKQHLTFDIFIALYHDQGLIPFKLLTAGSGVNYTAGLNIIRTSPDHGTAYDIAWQNRADFTSMIEAIDWGHRVCSNRRLIYGR